VFNFVVENGILFGTIPPTPWQIRLTEATIFIAQLFVTLFARLRDLCITIFRGLCVWESEFSRDLNMEPIACNQNVIQTPWPSSNDSNDLHLKWHLTSSIFNVKPQNLPMQGNTPYHYPLYSQYCAPLYTRLAVPINISRYCPQCHEVYFEPCYYLPLSVSQRISSRTSFTTFTQVPCRDLFYNGICLYVYKQFLLSLKEFQMMFICRMKSF